MAQPRRVPQPEGTTITAMRWEKILDVSGLEPPAPLEQVLAAIEQLRPGEYLCMLHRREPCLLFPILDQRGYCYHTQRGETTAYEILIWRRDDARAETAARWRIR